MALITGWGRQAWDDGPWGEPVPVTLTGFEATGAVGSLTVIGVANVTVDGQEATGAINGVGVNGNAVAVLPSIVSSVGTPRVLPNPDSTVTPPGSDGTDAVATVTA